MERLRCSLLHARLAWLIWPLIRAVGTPAAIRSLMEVRKASYIFAPPPTLGRSLIRPTLIRIPSQGRERPLLLLVLPRAFKRLFNDVVQPTTADSRI